MSQFHEGILKFTALRNSDVAPEGLGSLSVKFVRYPSAQQLVMWLPQPGYMGYSDYALSRDEHLLEQGLVIDKIGGSTQMLWDTLEWSPGNYNLKINHSDGWFHLLTFLKEEFIDSDPVISAYDTGVINELSLQNYLQELDEKLRCLTLGYPGKEPEKIDRDSYYSQQDFTNDEMNIRRKAQKLIEDTFEKLFQSNQDSQRLEYDEQGRSGTIYFIDGHKRVPFYYEMGGYPAHLVIDIPTPENWEQHTGISLDKRRETLLLIASNVRREKALSWRFEINDNTIVYYDA